MSQANVKKAENDLNNLELEAKERDGSSCQSKSSSSEGPSAFSKSSKINLGGSNVPREQ